ncbi:PD40 domain-containing protein [bacterium]|nr:PD40 domain-containing protein [bacterium]
MHTSILRMYRIIYVSLLMVSAGAYSAYGQDTTATDTTATVVEKKIELDSTQTLSEKLTQLFTQFYNDSLNAGLCFEIAQEYMMLGRNAYALRYLETSLRHDPTNMDVVYAKGDLLLAMGKRKSAYQAYLQIMRDFKGEAYVEKIGSRFASPYKITQVTNNSYNDILPSFSPDGSKILFQSDRSGNWDIYSMTLSQGEGSIVKLTNDPEADENASYSPDGRYIVFTSTREDKSVKKYKPREIYYMDNLGKSVKKVTTSYGADNWSPSFVDTSTIVFASDRADFSPHPFWEKSSSLYTIEKSGSFLFKIFHHDSATSRTDPRIDLTGRKILYANNKNGHYDLYMGDMEGEIDGTNLTDSKGNDIQPHMAKNGLFITFSSNRDGNYEIYKMQTDGKDVTRITYDDGDDLFPQFAPDGNRILFCSGRSGNFQIYLASLDDTVKPSVSDVIAALEKKISSASDN